MQLNIVPAKRGLAWVREGVQLLKRNPISLIGAQFFYLFLLLVISVLPYVGPLLASLLVPALNVGFLQTARLISLGQPALPHTLFSPMQAAPDTRKQLLLLGVVYVVLMLLVLVGVSVVDDGALLKSMFGLEAVQATEAAGLRAGDDKLALSLFALFTAPMALLFSYAPALVLWEQQTAAKALFVSVIAMLRNWQALLVCCGMWLLILGATVVLASTLIALVMNNLYAALMLIVPLGYVVMAAVFASFYVAYRDSFTDTLVPPAAANSADNTPLA
jgi:hypothetical protein